MLRHIENDRSSCSIGGLAAFDNGAAQKSPSERPFGHLQGEERIVGVDAWGLAQVDANGASGTPRR